MKYFGRAGLRCLTDDGEARLVYLSRRWQVIVHPTRKLDYWRVAGFGWGVRVGMIGIVRLP